MPYSLSLPDLQTAKTNLKFAVLPCREKGFFLSEVARSGRLAVYRWVDI
jgi:hypothetical protein